MRPLFIPPNVRHFDRESIVLEGYMPEIANNLKRLYSPNPEVSIIIPAFNEENNILKALYSISATTTAKTVEVIVVNNNSTDQTRFLAESTNAICINECQQGITHARNAGLSIAKGVYIINADADTIYPEDWIDNMINPLIHDSNIALTYGRFSFIPIRKTPRFLYFIYEYCADLNKYINRKLKEEAVNVYGFNSACRRDECLKVNGFHHPIGTNEDGWLAMKLKNGGFGGLFNVKQKKSIVWTTDRRIQIDGGIFIASIKRIWKYIRQ